MGFDVKQTGLWRTDGRIAYSFDGTSQTVTLTGTNVAGNKDVKYLHGISACSDTAGATLDILAGTKFLLRYPYLNAGVTNIPFWNEVMPKNSPGTSLSAVIDHGAGGTTSLALFYHP